MDCNIESPTLRVETESASYKIEFGQIQMEITGRCNMSCQHCRAAHELPQDMAVEQVEKIVRFARQFSPNYKEIVVSGGEPLIHRGFFTVLETVKNCGGDFVTLTTNGSLLTERHLDFIDSLGFERFMLSVSLDSLSREDHDLFRNCKGAYHKAIAAIKIAVKANISNVFVSVRSTLRPHQIEDMEKMARFAFNEGCRRVSFSSIHPAGRSIAKEYLWMTRDQKREFIEKIYELKGKYPSTFQISTNDPLKCLLRGFNDIGGDDELVFDGCAAAAVTFNVGSDGTMTPCALMNLPMMNVFKLSIDEMTEKYRESEIVKNMLNMNLRGKCGACSMKYQCGGCRARAMIRNGHYLAEDPDCWL